MGGRMFFLGELDLIHQFFFKFNFPNAREKNKYIFEIYEANGKTLQ